MGLDLSLVPDVVKPLARPLTGGAFPEADVGGLIAEAGTLENLADLLAEIKAGDAGAVVRMLRGQEWQGAAKETFEQTFAALGGQAGATGADSGEALLDLLEQALRDEAASLREHGVRMQHTEWMIYASLALLGAVIVRLLVWIHVHGPAVLALIREHTLLTQVSIQTMKRLVLMSTLKFAGIMGGLDLGVQAAQQVVGDREAGDFDLASLAMSAGSGALTGALFGGANAALSRLLSRQMVYVASRAELAVRDKIVAITQSMYGQALLGGAAGTAGAVPALALGGQLDASHLTYAFISGVAGGLDVPASARTSYLPMRAVAQLADPAHPGTAHPASTHADTAHPASTHADTVHTSTAHPASTHADTGSPHPAGERAPTRPVAAIGETTLAGEMTLAGAPHADTGPPPASPPPVRAPSDAAGPQMLSNGAIAGEVVRRQDTPLPSGDRALPVGGDRAVQDGTPARAPQNLPVERPQQNLLAERTPTNQSTPATTRAEAMSPGQLPRSSLLPATVPAITTATPDDAFGGEGGRERPQQPHMDAQPPREQSALPARPEDRPGPAASTVSHGDRTAGAMPAADPGLPGRAAEPDSPGLARDAALPAARAPQELAGIAVQERARPAGAHQVPGGPSPIADPRPRGFAEAAAIVHRWTPDNGSGPDGRRAGPENRIERLLSGPPDGPGTSPRAVPDEVLLAEGRRLTERLPVSGQDDTAARALALMGRSIGGPDQARAIHALANDLGLRLEIDALVDVFNDAQRYGLSPAGATDRAALAGILHRMMAADSHRWTGFRHQLRFSLPDANAVQARTIGLMVTMMGDPVTSTKVRNFTRPMLERYGIRDIGELLPVVRAAHQRGHIPHGTTGSEALLAAMDAFRREDPSLWNGVLLAERHALTDTGEPTARVLGLLDEIAARAEGTVLPLDRLAGEAGQGRSVEQLVRLAEDARAHGADLTRVAGPRELVDLLTTHRTRDPYLWDGLRIAAENGVTRPSDDTARVLSRLAEITGSEAPSRLRVFEPLRRLAGDAGLGYSVERLVDSTAEAHRNGLDLFGPVSRRQVLDALTRDAGTAAPRPPDIPSGLHDLSPSAVRDALRAASREHEAARQALPEGSPVLRRVRSLLTGPDLPAMAERERVASLEARVQAWQRWPDRPEVAFTRDFAAFRGAYDQAVERAVRGEAVIPYMLDDATASLAARDGGRGFGLELEFDLPDSVARQGLEAIARALHEAGLTGDARLHEYHTMKDRGYSSGKNGGLGLWRLEKDGTVAGELVSPILYDEPATWQNLRVAVDIIRSHGGTASLRTGGHVHVSTHDFDHIVENYTSVLNHVGHHIDTLFRLAHNPEAESHRGLKHCRPNQLPAAGYEPIGPVRHRNSGHDSAVNMNAMRGSSKDHLELRLWDGSLDPAVIQSQVKVSLALVEAAFRNATSGDLPNRGRPDPLGTHAELFTDPAQDRTERGSLSFRSLMDEIFWRAADKEQLTALYAATRWMRPQ
ncbi:hypothetical protein [Nonomuraea glycinis]|uniref:hypothetical protein n=1 Tax=Nonomuraea glycinis TaxID=2047744 RepID=UPI002E0E608E|nr:hypothetical protein OHA68_27580 [Nonomuraea glycinis]